MCQSKAEGGARCEYADQLANVRRKALYKHRDLPVSQASRKAYDAVEKWKAENKDIVTEHLPEHQPFQVEGKTKPVPQSLLSQLTPSSRVPVTGLPEEEQKALTRKLYAEHKSWEESMTDQEEGALSGYTITTYDLTNRTLRRTGLKEFFAKYSHMKTQPDPGDETYQEMEKRRARTMDPAFKKAPAVDEPRRLYRYFKVPAGVSPTEYLQRYFTPGEGFKDRGFMSTTMDPEFIMAHLRKKNGGAQNKGYVVMEILTQQGGSLQTTEETEVGRIQSMEKEILLPRNMRFRIADVRRSQRFEFADDRMDLGDQYGLWEGCEKGERMNFPMVQLVDEELIRETPED
jgi:hypothetical protein